MAPSDAAYERVLGNGDQLFKGTDTCMVKFEYSGASAVTVS